MGKFFKAAFFMCIFFVFLNCSNRTLHVFHWEEYINPDLVKQFEKEFNCKVELDIFDSNDDLYEKAKAKTKIYDIMFPSSHMAKRMYEERMLKVIERQKLPNLRNISTSFIRKSIDSAMRYSVPYMVSFTGIAYNKEMVKDFRPSWDMFGREDIAGRTGMFNDAREVIGAALKLNRISYNATDDNQLRKGSATVMRWKGNGVKFDDSKKLESMLVSGQLYLIQDYNGDALTLAADNKNIEFAIPEEGTAINLDNFVIGRDSANIELAYKFINFFLNPEISKANMEYVNYFAPNIPAQKLLSDEFMNNTAIILSQEAMLKSDHILDLGNINHKYDEIWGSINR